MSIDRDDVPPEPQIGGAWPPLGSNASGIAACFCTLGSLSNADSYSDGRVGATDVRTSDHFFLVTAFATGAKLA